MKHPSLNNRDRIAQKIEMPFPDYEMTVMAMEQPKNYFREIGEVMTCSTDKDSSIEQLELAHKIQLRLAQNSSNRDEVIFYKAQAIQTPKQLEMRIRLRKKLEKKKSKKK